MQTRRHPRTMAEAFGPYTSDILYPMRETRTEKAAGVILAIVIGLLLALLLVHQLSK